MADVPPPVLSDDPSQAYPAYFDMQRKQMLAQMLMQNMQRSSQTPDNWNSMKLVPRRSPLSSLTTVLGGYLAGQGLNSANQAQQKYFQTLSAPQTAPQAQSQGADQNMSPAPWAPQSSGPAPAPQQGSAPQGPQTGLPNQGPFAWKAQLDASPQGRYMKYYEPGKYAQLVAENFAKWNMPPDKVKEILAAGLPPDQEAAALRANALPMTGGERPGMPRMQAGKIVGYAPDPSAGVAYDVGPDNQPVARPITGQAGIEAERAGQIQAAKEAVTPRMIPQGGGVERLGYAPPPPSAQQPPPKSYFSTPQSQSPAAPPKAASGSPWASVPKINIPNTPGQTTDAYHSGVLKTAVAKDEELVNKLGPEADLADQRLAFNKEALGVLSGAETGPLADTLTKLGAKAAEMHVKLPWLPDEKTVNDSALLKKFLLRNPLLNLKPTFGGRPAAAEFQVLANDASPSPQMLKASIARLVQMDSTQAEYAKQKAADYQKYQGAGGDPRQFETWYANKFPLARHFLKADTNPAAVQRLQQHPEFAEAFRKKYGWQPYPDE